MAPKKPQRVHPYSVKIETATGKPTSVPVTLLTPKQAEEVQSEFKKMAQDTGVKGARIQVQRVSAGDYERIVREAKAALRAAARTAA
jgi:hypothetical protein